MSRDLVTVRGCYHRADSVKCVMTRRDESGGGAEATASDEETLVALMLAYQAGELDAFERLYACLATDVRRYFALVVRDAGVTADLVQETFLEMHRSRHTYAPPLPVRPWIFGIARHVRWRHRRLVTRRARHEDAGVEATDAIDTVRAARASIVAVTPPMADALIERREIEAALAELPETRRSAWVLHHVHGFSFQEVAARLRIGVGAAKLRSSRAMRTLRARFGATREGGRDE